MNCSDDAFEYDENGSILRSSDDWLMDSVYFSRPGTSITLRKQGHQVLKDARKESLFAGLGLGFVAGILVSALASCANGLA